jgi:hypothetical protein
MTLLTLFWSNPTKDAPGISTITPYSILYGTDGYITVNDVDLGATLGDIVIEWGVTHYYPDLFQARGPLSGTGKATDGFFRTQVTIAEWAWAILAEVMGSVGSDSSGDSYKLGGQALGRANEIEVEEVIVTGVTKRSGRDFKATIPKAYVTVGGITLSKKQETGLQLTFEGLYTTDAPTTLPGYIEIEKGNSWE